jgi:hypothetical protein
MTDSTTRRLWLAQCLLHAAQDPLKPPHTWDELAGLAVQYGRSSVPPVTKAELSGIAGLPVHRLFTPEAL